MGRHSTPTRSDLECMLRDENAEPKALPLSLLEDITNGFSDKQEIGRGGYAVVYKGMLENGAAVAVKRLSKTHLYEKEFQREVECLIKVNHRNVIRFIGYCADSQGIAANYNGNFVMADVQQRLLCFEYLAHGTLDRYIDDASCGIDWRKRYKIINGICKGLNYLHQNRILHLDLKPLNILLDDNMLPKITDFGLSRCFAEKQTRAITANIGGTVGYLAPEFSNGEITYRFDLYSLGVIIIEILTGKKGYHKVDDVVKRWSNRLDKSQHGILLEQVRVCAEIGIECIDSNPAKRPDTQNIIDRLNKTERMNGYIEAAAVTSLQAENAPNELHHNTPQPSGETSYEAYLQSTLRIEETRVKSCNTDQWMSYRLLPDNLKEQIRCYEQYRWQETRGVDEENLPKDLIRAIKRHIGLSLLKRVPMFEKMDDQLLNVLCDRLKPVSYTEGDCIAREGDPVNEMFFIMRGNLMSMATNGGKAGFLNSDVLKDGDFYGGELLTWALDSHSPSSLPNSTRTVKSMSEVEAFALMAEDMKFVVNQFQRFCSRHWRTWAACFIQAAWRRRRKKIEDSSREMENRLQLAIANDGSTSLSFGAAIHALRFARNMMRINATRKARLQEVYSLMLLKVFTGSSKARHGMAVP